MNSMENTSAADSSEPTNGSGAAAILAAGIGAFALAVLAIMADRVGGFGKAMILYKPTGPLSGVTTCATLAWLAAWVILHLRWRNRTVAFAHVGAVAFILLILGLLLTFPPLASLL